MKQSNERKLPDQLLPVRRALWVALTYLLVGFAWIGFSDSLFESWFQDPETLARLQTWKGAFFILVTGLVLFVVILRQLYRDRALLRLQFAQRQALRARERQLTVLMDNLPGMAYRCRYDSQWTMLFVSDGCIDLTGYEPAALVNNRQLSFADLMDHAANERLQREVKAALDRGEPFSVEYSLIRKGGDEIWVWERGRGVVDDDGETVLEGIVLDISDRKALENELAELATRDSLTGLLNRREVSRLLEEELERARRYHRTMALLWIDFDHFKEVNDTCGHAAGDSVLKAVSALLLDSVRTVDSVGRFGGEEFVIVLPEMEVVEARETAERLRRQVASMPHPLGDGNTVPLTISIGVAVYPSHGLTAADLCAAADKAMYRAKEQGRNCVSMAELSEHVHNGA
ncbi:sensor domain-containing diguanylate cyclase [Marinobacter sp. M216]|uniref:Sensor domain-containing diguanylate cyclase n=1 Tax=Marinobacter albus TaxID=3030833 RepID=A0ABT7HET4_9GAMM|nr:sensor domain-containing diguanylate cyclase [Marinobacter sp. M216]MDK9558412.1 sensor domain-containing diguanylate cyclase [Marinobacter sp. M216]